MAHTFETLDEYYAKLRHVAYLAGLDTGDPDSDYPEKVKRKDVASKRNDIMQIWNDNGGTYNFFDPNGSKRRVKLDRMSNVELTNLLNNALWIYDADPNKQQLMEREWYHISDMGFYPEVDASGAIDVSEEFKSEFGLPDYA